MSEPEDDGDNPSSLRGFFLRSLIVVGWGILGCIVWLAGQGVILIFASILLAIMINRLTTYVYVTQLSGWPRAVSLTFVIGSMIVAGAGTCFFLGYQIWPALVDLVSEMRAAAEQLLSRARSNSLTAGLPKGLPSPAEFVADRMKNVSGLGTLLMTPFGLVINSLFVFFTAVYFAVAGNTYLDGVIRLFPVERRARMREVADELQEGLWRWSIARLFTMFVTGFLTWLAMFLLGIPLAFTIGLMTGLLVFIPNIGAVLAVIPPLLLASQMEGLMPLWVLLVYVGVQLVESYILTPIVQKDQVNLMPAFVLCLQMIAGLMTGVIGVAFATPLGLAALIIIRELYVRDRLEKPSPMA